MQDKKKQLNNEENNIYAGNLGQKTTFSAPEYLTALEQVSLNMKQMDQVIKNAVKITTEPYFNAAVNAMKAYSNEFSSIAIKNYDFVLTNMALKEVTKSIVNNEYLFSAINGVSLDMQKMITKSKNLDGISNVLNTSLMENLSKFKLQINDIISNCSVMKPTFIALNKLNFNKYVWSEIPSEELTNDIINSTDINKTIEIYKSGLDIKIIDKCLGTNYIKSKNELFTEIIDNYKRGNFYIAVVGITSLIDGLMSYMTKNNTSRFDIRKNEILNKIQRNKLLINEDEELFALAMTSECMLNTFFMTKDFNEKEPDLINRHWIMHCQTNKVYTQYEFKKILYFLYGLLRLDELN